MSMSSLTCSVLPPQLLLSSDKRRKKRRRCIICVVVLIVLVLIIAILTFFLFPRIPSVERKDTSATGFTLTATPPNIDITVETTVRFRCAKASGTGAHALHCSSISPSNSFSVRITTLPPPFVDLD